MPNYRIVRVSVIRHLIFLTSSLSERMGTVFRERLMNWVSERFEDSCPPNWYDVVEVEDGYLEHGMDLRGLR